MIIDPRHLEQISIIVDAGTLQRAADKIGTSQPALSRMIRTLEARVEAALFEPNRRPLKPTPLGLELANQGRAVRVARERAMHLVDDGRKGIVGTLRIGAPPFLCERLVSEAIAAFLATRPSSRVSLVPDYFPGLHQGLLHNQLDLVIGPAKSADPTLSEIAFEPLFEDRNVVVARAGHPLFDHQVNRETLSAVTWVGHSDRSMLRHDMETALRLIGLRDFRFAFQSESAGAVLELVRRTDFLTILPLYAMRSRMDDTLAIVPIDLPTVRQTIAMMHLLEGKETKLAIEFKAHLRAHVAAMSDPI